MLRSYHFVRKSLNIKPYRWYQKCALVFFIFNWNILRSIPFDDLSLQLKNGDFSVILTI
jgi:hypothetical protein